MTKEIKDLGGKVVTSTSDTTTICISSDGKPVHSDVSLGHAFLLVALHRGSGEDVKDDEGSQVA